MNNLYRAPRHWRRRLITHILPILDNQEEVWHAFVSDNPLPPFMIKGFDIVLHHAPEDEPEYLLWEIFVATTYSTEGFYQPAASHTIVDCGANIGVFALWMATREPLVNIHCFEPARATRERLTTNVHHNRLAERVTIYPYGILGSCKQALLNPTWASGHRSFLAHGRAPEGKGEMCDCLTLEEALLLSRVGNVDLLKLDVEGAEVEILESVRGHLRGVTRIIVEYHDYILSGAAERILQQLLRQQFRIVKVTSSGGEGRESGMIFASRM